MTVRQKFFKLKFSKFLQNFRTLNVFGKFLLIVIDSKQLSIAIWLGLPLHQFQKNWLLSDQYFTLQFDHFYALAWYQMLRHAMIYRIGIGRHMMAKGDGLKEKLTFFRFYLDKTRKKSK